jgi:hypothetical protein
VQKAESYQGLGVLYCRVSRGTPKYLIIDSFFAILRDV